VQAALPLLNEGASIILCGSNGDVKAAPGASVYAASKAAIRSLGRSWAAELIDRKIRVNVVAPGLTETPGLLDLFAGSDDALADLTSTVPVKRRARPEEIGSVVAFLASDGSSFMTGSEIYVDGGASQF
jgi:NAD(P)-dependent dehydrogenase (short-subunit alcohol dehydrogenase family)